MWRLISNRFILSLVIASFVSEILFAYSAIHEHSLEFDYLTWNLLLAWLPLIFVSRLNLVLKRKPWSSWEALALSLLWLVFLPNSFYMISDFIHLQDVSAANVNYDAIMLAAFIFTGVVLGFTSLFLVHLHLRQRLSALSSGLWIGLTMFICSVAIYFGRDLRWNSWNVLTNPGGLLFDISNRLLHITSYPDMVTTIIAFFLLLLAMYNIIWHSVRLIFGRQRSTA